MSAVHQAATKQACKALTGQGRNSAVLCLYLAALLVEDVCTCRSIPCSDKHALLTIEIVAQRASRCLDSAHYACSIQVTS